MNGTRYVVACVDADILLGENINMASITKENT
jgi:hypothetical protein